jgi:DNA-binding CsgD family transcriptional regulator
LVPPAIASEAALGLMTAGVRGHAVIELALIAGRANVTVEVAARHLLDDNLTLSVRRVAAEALGKVGTVQARSLLAQAARRHDELGEVARHALARPAAGISLSDREIEVLNLAGRGLTNRQIALRLRLSEHTIARHVANARSKLGAANRVEAVSRLAEAHRSVGL